MIQHNHRTGLFIAGADAVVDRTLMGSTSTTPDGLYGDGVVVRYDDRWSAGSTLVANELRIDHNARAGLAVFGAEATLGRSAVGCNALDLTTDEFESLPATLQDVGHNLCGRPMTSGSCHAVSPGLQPPDPL